MASAQAFYAPSLTSAFTPHRYGTRRAVSSSCRRRPRRHPASSRLQRGHLAEHGLGRRRRSRRRSTTTADQSDSNNALFNPQYNSNWNFELHPAAAARFRIDATRRTIRVTGSIATSRTSSSGRHDQHGVEREERVLGLRVRHAGGRGGRSSRSSSPNKLVADNQTRVEIGTMAPIDVVQAQAEQATRRQGLVGPRTAAHGRAELKRLIVSGTEDPNWTATLDPVDRPEFRPEQVDLEAAIRRALSERTESRSPRRTSRTTTSRWATSATRRCRSRRAGELRHVGHRRHAARSDRTAACSAAASPRRFRAASATRFSSSVQQ